MSLIEAYVIGALITSCWIVTWFLTGLPLHVWSILRLMPKEQELDLNDLDLEMVNDRPETWEDWETLVFNQSKFFDRKVSNWRGILNS